MLHSPNRDVHRSLMAFYSVKKLLMSTLCMHPAVGWGMLPDLAYVVYTFV